MKTPEGFWKGMGVGTLTGTGFGLSGYLLARHPETAGLGVTMFVLVPCFTGFAIALVTGRPGTKWVAAALAVLVSLGILIAFRQEGVLCALLALPIVAAGLALGSLAGFLFRRYVLDHSKRPGTSASILLALAPILIIGARNLELPGLETPRRESVTGSIRAEAAPDKVWRNIVSIDRIQAQKPLLMYFGLPVPVRCSLEGDGVGAKRTCYFENGSIQETVTEWNPPYAMRLTIDRTNMPGRHWLGFEDAHYELSPSGSTTLLTRTTTFTSRLAPVWYWRYFERLGIEAEHAYILRDLAERVKR